MGINIGGNPFDWNGQDWEAFAFGGPQMVGANQELTDIRNSAQPPPPIDPRIIAALTKISDVTGMVNKLQGRFQGAGMNPAAAAAAAARYGNQMNANAARMSQSRFGSLQQLMMEVQRQIAALNANGGDAPPPVDNQLGLFFSNLG